MSKDETTFQAPTLPAVPDNSESVDGSQKLPLNNPIDLALLVDFFLLLDEWDRKGDRNVN